MGVHTSTESLDIPEPLIEDSQEVIHTQIVAPDSPNWGEMTRDERKGILLPYATQRAAERGVSIHTVKRIINCENYEWLPDLQSRMTYGFSDPANGIYYGEREKSWGLSQIHAPAWPHITYEQMTDPYFSIDFLVDHLAQGNGFYWSCY